MNDTSGAALIWCPFADEETAAAAAIALLDEGLIACANIQPPVRSLFVWKGERDEGQEVPALFKTSSALLEQAVARLEVLHPYEAPAICGWHCDAAGEATLRWLSELKGG